MSYLNVLEDNDMADAVNLDALISREDFQADEGTEFSTNGKSTASITDLTAGESFYQVLRKPDFQRETAAWSPQAICNFITAFVDGDLIPAVILWQSPSRLSFVIDGAHRLSAIMAWLLDDYGDGPKSKIFYSHNISPKQIKLAKQTRDLISKSVGSYSQLRQELQKPGSYPEVAARAKALAHGSILLQWVNTQDPKKAERAFFTINQSAVDIDPTELKILNTRFKPNAVAARAIVRNSTGHKYWEKFSPDGQKKVEETARNIYAALYNPPLDNPIRTNELPIAGNGYGAQTLPLIYDLVNIANELPVVDSSKKNKKPVLTNEQEEISEPETLKVLEGAKTLAQMMTSTDPSSLGLYPAVYFYSSNGRHQPTVVLALANLLVDMKKHKKLNAFTSIRSEFEEFLIEYKGHINQLTTQYGGMTKGYKVLKEYCEFVIDAFLLGKSATEIEASLKDHPKFYKLVKEKIIKTNKAKDFSQNAKSFVVMKNNLAMAHKCSICGARVDHKSMTLDHTLDKKLGGLATVENSGYVHPYCNSAYKDFKARSVAA